MNRRPTLIAAGTIAGTTLGAGLFAMPYLAATAGILPTAFFLASLSAAVIYAHTLYWRVLRDEAPGTHLLELARRHLGAVAARGTFVATVLGLTLTITSYLALGTAFVKGLFPAFPDAYATLLFWLACSLPLAFRLKRFIAAELFMTAVMSGALAILVLTVPITFSSFVLADWSQALLPFGPILFALAGWSAVEPAIAAVRGQRGHRIPSLALGTVTVAILYFLFALTLGSAGDTVTPDTFTGVLGSLPSWQTALLLVAGLFAILTSYLPMNLELKNAFRRGLGWRRSSAFTAALFLPYLLVLAGFDSFLSGVELVGGVFVVAQYVAILQVARAALRLRGWHRFAANAVSVLFALAGMIHVIGFVAPGLGLR